METLVKNPELESQLALTQALDQYTQTQAYGLRDIYSVHIGGQRQIDTSEARAFMQQNYTLLESVDPHNEMQDEEPAMTICIPVGLLQEDQQTIDTTLDAIHASQQASGKTVEVILWTNYAAPVEDPRKSVRERFKDGRKQAKANRRYQDIREAAARFNGSGLQIKTALQANPEDREFSMSAIRSDYMEALAVHAEKQGYGYEHPVLWLDADTPYITKSSLGSLEEKIRNFDSLIVHANQRYTIEWAKGKPVSKMDKETRAVMVSEIRRRIASKVPLENDPERGVGYPEESGFGFALGTYLDVGGVDTKDPISESGLLKGRINSMSDTRPDLFHRPTRSDNEIPVITYVRSARIGLSGRRHYQEAKRLGTIGLSTVTGMSEYTLATQRKGKIKPEGHAKAINRENMHEFIDRRQILAGYRSSKHFKATEKEQQLLHNMVDKTFKD